MALVDALRAIHLTFRVPRARKRVDERRDERLVSSLSAATRAPRVPRIHPRPRPVYIPLPSQARSETGLVRSRPAAPRTRLARWPAKRLRAQDPTREGAG